MCLITYVSYDEVKTATCNATAPPVLGGKERLKEESGVGDMRHLS